LGIAHLCFAVPQTFTCEMATRLFFGPAADPPDEQHCQLQGLHGSGLLTAAAMLFTLAVSENNDDSKKKKKGVLSSSQ
jgi:hypothetical protein